MGLHKSRSTSPHQFCSILNFLPPFCIVLAFCRGFYIFINGFEMLSRVGVSSLFVWCSLFFPAGMLGVDLQEYNRVIGLCLLGAKSTCECRASVNQVVSSILTFLELR